MTAPVRFPRFFVTSPAPCPYLPGRSERKVFTELKGPHAEALNEALGRIGFRRSQTVAYRPSCLDCQACVSVRVPVRDFVASTTQKRNVRRNQDLVTSECRPWATGEQFDLLRKYLGSRHPGGGMAAMDEIDYADMVEHTPVTSYVVEYREPSNGLMPGRLVGACLTDRQGDGLSMIYSFYDPEHEARAGLGNYIILDHILRTAAEGLDHVYLGYWVDGSERMQYKIRYRPIELLGRDGWRRLDSERHDALIAAAASAPSRARDASPAKDASLPQMGFAEKLALLAAVVAALVQPIPALAQSQSAPASLEDLIPDSAVANPEAWALDGKAVPPADQPATDPLADANQIDPASPLADLPPIDVPWPDDIVLPQLAPLEPDDSIQFADSADTGETAALADAQVMRLTGELVLAFPPDPAAFPEREAFAERFKGISTIAELGSSGDNSALLAARAKADQTLLDTLLRVYGYYDAQIIRSIGGIQAGEDAARSQPEVRFDVIPGPRYRFGAVDLGDLATAPDGDALRRGFEIVSGDPMSSDAIVTEQADLDRLLGETGYAFAAINAPDLLVDHARTEGDLTLKVHPNGKFKFGEVNSNLPTFLSGKHLASIARFDPGDIYQRSLEQDLRRAIVATGLVSSVTITPRKVADPSGATPGTVALDVEMTKAKLRTIAGAIGYGTGEGFRAEASWEHRNLFPPEGMLRVRGIAGTKQQLAGVTFRKNNFGGRDKVLTLDAFASTISSQAYEAQTLSAIGTYERLSTLLFQKPISYSVGLEAVATRQRPQPVGGVRQPLQTYFIGALPLYALLDTTDSLLDPKTGFRTGLRLSPETSRTQGMQSFYLRAQADASTYRRITDRVVVAARVRYGAIPGAKLIEIAPSRRFYAGGGGSVRGYAFQAIGPRDAAGLPTGGRSLLEGAIEARVGTGFFDGALSVVPFLDAGAVGQKVLPDFKTIRYGAGIGVRYNTGFGPLRLDVATPINPGPGDSRVAVYVSLGQAF